MSKSGAAGAPLQTSQQQRPFVHPLAGATLAGLVRVLAAHGGFAPRYAAQVGFMIAGAILRLPTCAVEWLRVSLRGKDGLFDLPPVFIVGHWRSGTTYLHNLMSCDPGFAFPTITDALRPHEFFPGPLDFISRTILLRSLPATRPMDAVPLRDGWPQEEELALASMAAPSFFNCFYFPQRMRQTFAREVLFKDNEGSVAERWRRGLARYLAKLAMLNPGRRLLLKNPANSARIPHLKALFPGAKFIHIHRDPLDVYRSTCKLYERMFPIAALQDYPSAVGPYVLWAYGELMDALFEGLAALPETDRVDVSYAELIRDPAATLEKVYQALHIGNFAPLRAQLPAAIQTFGAATPPAAPPAEQLPGEAADALRPYRVRLGYEKCSMSPLERVA